jgi:hypothetical protein
LEDEENSSDSPPSQGKRTHKVAEPNRNKFRILKDDEEQDYDIDDLIPLSNIYS